MSNSPPEGKKARAHPFRVLALPAGLLTALVLISLWFGFAYTGVLRWLAELEFRTFDRWHPAVTVLVFGGILVLVWYLLRYRGRRRRTERAADEAEARLEALLSMRRLHRAFLFAVGLASGMAIGALLYWTTLPSRSGDPQVGPVQDLAILREGPVRLVGAAPIGPVARYREGIWGFGPDQFFVPVRSRTTPLGAEYDLFVEVTRWNRPEIDEDNIGVLRRDALPGELIVLYRARNMRVVNRPSVIFLNEGTAHRATVFFLFEALAAALIALGFALIMRRRIRAAEKEIERINAESAQNAAPLT